jgi:hypothetical protein
MRLWNNFIQLKERYTMKSILILTFALITSFSFGQKLKFKVANQKDTTVFLVKYFGQKLYYADTAEMKGGYVEFDGKKQQPGISPQKV